MSLIRQPGDAAKLFAEALQADPAYAPAYLELARVTAEGFDKRAIELAQKALQQDPKLYQAHELLAYLALEDTNSALATQEAEKAIALSNDAFDGMAVLASIDWLAGKDQSGWMDRILKADPAYGEAYATGAHFFVINTRYEEGIRFFRKALALNPDLWDARRELGINLLRVGNETEAREQLQRCFDAHESDAQTRNALRFLDTTSSYQTFRTANTEIVLNAKEAALLRPYIEPELQRAIGVYERKYGMKLPGPLRLEVYPNHDDFVVRTLGLPGQGGLLGVTFGLIIAMDSPSARPPGEFTWASTLWHELSHAYVLTATHHLVPRWFTEGVSVHEEGAASPEWRDRLTPGILSAIQHGKLLPVLQLDRGFVHPEFPEQVIVSYYQAGQICDYIAEKWGDRAILGMIHSYADRKTTAAAIEDNLRIKPEDFDKQFQAWLSARLPKEAPHSESWAQMKQHALQLHDATQEQAALERLNYIYLEDEQVHRELGSLLVSHDPSGAVREFRAVLALNPPDIAESHYNLARALNAAHQVSDAKDQILIALEAAPNYKPAQQLLLQLSQ